MHMGGGGKIKNFIILIFLFDFLGGRGGGGVHKISNAPGRYRGRPTVNFAQILDSTVYHPKYQEY